MHFVALIIAIISSFLWGGAPAHTKTIQPLFRTHIPLNTQRGCAVTVNAWLSPSCTHCSQYFAHDIPKITAMPGFCMDLHLLPNLYLLDMPVAILIWSQGPENAYKNVELFFKNQKEWLDKSTSKEDDPKRVEDIKEYLQEIKSDSSKNIEKIKNYLVASDPFLYVKIFALRHFSIEHVEKYLPSGVLALNSTLALSLMKDLPRKEGSVVNFSPAFTDKNGHLLPDSQLKYGILTPSAAEDLLKAAGPIAATPPASPPAATMPATRAQAPMTAPVASDTRKPAASGKAIKRTRIDSSGAQDADDELHRTLLKELNNHDADHETAQPTKNKQKISNNTHGQKFPSKATHQSPEPSPYDDLEEDMELDDDHLPDDETTKRSKELEAVLNKALQGLDAGPDEQEIQMDHMVN